MFRIGVPARHVGVAIAVVVLDVDERWSLLVRDRSVERSTRQDVALRRRYGVLLR